MLENTTALVPVAYETFCNNATNQMCVGVSGDVSYLPDFKAALNQTCGQFLPSNKTLVETAAVVMGGITMAVGVDPSTVGNVSNYVQAAANVIYCGHEAMKAVSPTYDTASALIGAAGAVGAGLAAAVGVWGLLKCTKTCRDKSKSKAAKKRDRSEYDALEDGRGASDIDRAATSEKSPLVSDYRPLKK